MRNQIIQLKVSLDEKNQIQYYAQQYGGTLSQYIRHQLLELDDAPNGIDKQNLIRTLCGHARLIEQIEDPQLRGQLENLEAQLWQLIK